MSGSNGVYQAKWIIEGLKLEALEWAAEEGLGMSKKGRPKSRLQVSNVIVTDFGFKVTVVELAGDRMATCTYLSTGARSMYELDKKGG